MHHCDVAIVGDGFGGLVAGALLSASGKKTIILSPGSPPLRAGAESASDGLRFPAGPSLTYGFEEGGEFRQLFRDLGLQEEKPVIARAYQVALPQRRITVFSDLANTLDELKREFPRDFPAIATFYRDLGKEALRVSKSRIADFFARHSSAGRFIGKYSFSPEVISFFNVQSIFFFQRPAAQLSFSALIRLCKLNPCQYYGGIDKLTGDLRAFIIAKGGAFHYDTSIPVTISRKGHSTVIKTDNDEVAASSVLFCKLDATMLVRHFGIQDDVVPVGMERDVLYQPDPAQPKELFILSLGNRNDGSPASTGMRSLTVAVKAANPQSMLQVMAGRIEDIIPFFNEFAIQNVVAHPFADFPLPSGVTFKPLRTGSHIPIAFKSSVRRLYLLDQRDYAPLQVIQAIRFLIKQMAR